MVKFGFILFPLLFFLIPDFLSGQDNYVIKNFTTEQGLPHNHVKGIAQDKSGFIWIATWDGLSRYDGYEFRNYFHNPDDSTTISYFQTEDILVDTFDNVWVGSVHYLSKYNPPKDNFTRYYQTQWYNHLALDKNKILWTCVGKNALFWNNKTQKFEEYPFSLDIEFPVNLNYVSIIFDNVGQAWLLYTGIYGNTYFYRINLRDDTHQAKFIGKLDNSRILKSLPGIPTFQIKPIITPEGNIWLLSNHGVFRLNSEKQEFYSDPTFIPKIQLAGLNKNDISVAEEFLRHMLPHFPDKNKNPSDGRVTENYLIDRQKNIWASYLMKDAGANGLTRKSPAPRFFKHYFLEANPSGGLNPFFPVLKDKIGTVWGGATNQNKLFAQNKDGIIHQIVPTDEASYQIGLRPRAFLEDSTGFWIGYFGGLILRYEFESRKFSTVLIKKTGLADYSLPHSALHIKKQGNNLIIVGFKDIFLYDLRTKEFKSMKHFSLNDYINIYSIMKDHKNNWWVGASLSQLLFFDSDFKEMKTFRVGKGEFNIEEVVEGDNNDLWLSTLGGGLAHFDITTAKTKIYTTADGLSNNTCYGMLKDKLGNLWISTNHGISRFNPKTEQFRAFGATDGLNIDEFNSDNAYLAPDGEMFFAGMGGVVSFYPDSIAEEQMEPPSPLVIEEFKVSGANRFFKKAIYECDTVILKKGDTNFEASFACLDFRNADKIKYRYRLVGENSEFVTTDHRQRSANCSSLSPRTYLLTLVATNRDGDWVSHRALTIIIPAFYYQTIGFKIAIIFLIILLVSYLVYGYNRRIRLVAGRKQEELRLESLRGQMNPHFIFNSLNSINYFISQNDRLSANRYIADFSRLIRTILGNTTSDYITLSKELESLNDYLKLEHLRFGDKFDYQLTISEGISTEELLVSPGLVQPFIENAIWHGIRGLEGRKGTIKISFNPGLQGSLNCLVEDDGVGRKRSEKCKSTLPGKTSRGIGIVLERLKIINKLRQTNFRINIEDLYPDHIETGTRVSIDIPVR